MKKILYLPLLLMLFNGCQPDEIPNIPNLKELSAGEVQVVKGSNDFAFDLFRQLQHENATNTFISPLSVTLALAMTANGADDGVAHDMLKSLGCEQFSVGEVNEALRDLTGQLLTMDRKIELGMANSVWYSQQYTVNHDFASTIRDFFNGKVQGLDFNSTSAKDVINRWAEDNTKGRIKNLLENIAANEIMFLINTVYFKGEWKYKFDKSHTHAASYKTFDGGETTVDMMSSEGVALHFFQNSQLQLVDVPYGNGQFNFTILMPNNPSSLTEFVNTLTEPQFTSWLDQSDSLSVTFDMPRFKMTWQQDLKKTLHEMGMPMAGFPKLFDPAQSLEITRVIHKTFLEVNEQGSEAAAATAVGIGYTSLPSQPMHIVIDRPFVFMIREKHTNAILFLGQMLDPSLLSAM